MVLVGDNAKCRADSGMESGLSDRVAGDLLDHGPGGVDRDGEATPMLPVESPVVAMATLMPMTRPAV